MISIKQPQHIIDLINNKSGLFNPRLSHEYSMQVTYGGINTLTTDVCFARIGSVFNRREKKSKTFYYFLICGKPELFNYLSLLSELQVMLNGAFIVRVYKYYKTGYIIEFKERSHTNKDLALYTYTVVFAMLRAIDGEFYPRWEGLDKSVAKEILPVEHWNTIITYFYFKASPYMGHGINDDIAAILHKQGATSVSGKKVVDKFIAVLSSLFSTKIKITNEQISKIRATTPYAYNYSQTPSYRILERLAIYIKKGAKDE